jgi:ABC-type Fe3+-hydroxamate transport system substrate-binding protein
MAAPAPPTETLVDAAGTAHPPACGSVRIVSLVPSITELLFALGLAGQVVGRTAFCVHPEGQVRQVRSVGGTKSVNLEKVRELEPTHVIVNIDETPKALALDLARTGARVVVTHPIEVLDNLALYRLLGGLFHKHAEAGALADAFEEAFGAVAATACGLPERRVLCLIWKKPWMTVSRDTYVSRMLALVRWTTVPADSPDRYPVIELTEDLLHGCDRVLFTTEPFPFKPAHLDAFRAAFPEHSAKACLVDGQMLTWYGSRAIPSLHELRRIALAPL